MGMRCSKCLHNFMLNMLVNRVLKVLKVDKMEVKCSNG